MKHKQFLLAGLLLGTTAVQAETMLDEIVVTATRSEQPLSQTLAHTTVIGREAIQSSQATDVATLLRRQASIEITQSGGIGQQSSLFLRGSNSNHALVLVDGVRLNSATTGATAIDQLMLDEIERIEIVRGNVSSVYGSEAIGGVIQIFTRRSQGQPALNLSGGLGSYQTRRASVGYGGSTDEARFHLQASLFDTAGYSVQTATASNGVNPDADGYHNRSYSGTLDYTLAQDQRLLGGFFLSEGIGAYDNAWDTPQDSHEANTRLGKWNLGWEGRLNPLWRSKVQWAQGEDRYEDLKNGNATWHAATTTRQLNWDNFLEFDEKNTLHLGAERLTQTVASSNAYTLSERQVDALLAGLTSRTATQELQLNARQDRYSDSGNAQTWLAAYGIDVAQNWQLRASASTGFRAPTFNDLHAPAGWGANPNLLPEESRHTEFGLRHLDDSQRFEVAYFDNRIHNLIVADNTWTMQNLEQARITGWELAWQKRYGESELSLNHTWQDPRNEQTGGLLPKRARRFGNLNASTQYGNWHFSGEFHYSDTRQDGGQELAAYTLVNLSLRYAFSQRLQLSARLDNAFDRDYVLANGYNTAGRTWFIGMNYQ